MAAYRFGALENTLFEPGESGLMSQVADMPIAAVAIIVEASQPRVVSQGVSVKWPVTWRRDPMSMIGTAATPLTTALQGRALIGSRG
jgi:hypothetical protein